MNVHEPMTVLTDYMLTIASAIFAIRLWRSNRLWALAFVFTASGSFFGGTFHGFGPMVTPIAAQALWKATTFSIGLASFYLLIGVKRRRAIAVFAIVKLVAYLSWMISHDAFVWVIVDYATTLVIVGVVQLVWRTPSTRWVIGSIAVSAIAAIVQITGNNVLYHLIQLVGLWLLYRGGTLMNRSTAPPMTQPT
jgi:hypothetical protein